MRRALAIDETSYGSDHPEVAIRLNNLAQLLKATNRLGEAEPLMRRALAIDEASFGSDHPKVAIRLNNLAGLLQDTNRLGEAEPLMRRALEIFVAFTKRTGHLHPHLNAVARNYRGLLEAMGRSPDEASAALTELLGPIADKLVDPEGSDPRASESGKALPRVRTSRPQAGFGRLLAAVAKAVSVLRAR